MSDFNLHWNKSTCCQPKSILETNFPCLALLQEQKAKRSRTFSFRKKGYGYSSWWITIKGKFFSFVSRCSHVWCRSGRFDYILLVFCRRWGRLVMRDLIKRDALLWLVVFSTAFIGAFRSLLFSEVICSLGGPMSHGSLVVVFFDRGHPRFCNFYSTILVDVVKEKSYMNCLFNPARVVIRVTINKLNFVPEWLV